MRKSGRGKDALAKTGMYDGVGSNDRSGNGEGASMDLGNEQSDLGAFEERRARLERAARLLHGAEKEGPLREHLI